MHQLQNQYHQATNMRQMLPQGSNVSNQGQNQVQFYQPHQQNSELGSQKISNSYGAPTSANQQNVRTTYPSQAANLNPGGAGIDMMARDNSRKANSKNRSGVRPSSATVAGQAGRFLSNQQSKRKYAAGQTAGGQSGQSQMTNSQLDQISYSYQQPPSQQPMQQPMVNNLMHQSSNQALNPSQQYGAMQNLQVPQMGMHASPNQFGSHRNSNQMLSQQPLPQRPPIAQGRKKTRPQSAARNQMQPAKALQSVTNFTYQKAKQNLNQKAYLPESLKNTDKEKLYEEKISLKKQLNEMLIENQQLRTQLQSQNTQVKKKDEMVQQVMKQIFHPTAAQNTQGENFLQDFHNREIHHNMGQANAVGFVKGVGKPKTSAAKIVKNQNLLANKDSLITSLKLKMKENTEGLTQKEKELQDLKQTLKFTKIKEYETELALNVQESQRLRVLLEREMQKPRVDPRLFQALKQQNSQFQQIIQNPQQNQQIMVANIDKLNHKLIGQVNKFAKLKAARKRVVEKNHRLEKKVMILNNKLNQMGNQRQPRNTHAAQGRRSSSRPPEDMVAKQNLAISKQIIDRLLAKMADCGIEVSEEELIEMQQQFQPEASVEDGDPTQDQPFARDQDEDMDPEKPLMAAMDLIVTFGAPQQEEGSKNSTQAITKQMQGAQFGSFDDLKETLRKEFEISDMSEFQIKFVNEDGSLMELSQDNWDQIRELSQTNQIQLAIELLNQENQEKNEEEEEEEEASNYEDDFEEVAPVEKVYTDPIASKQVTLHFDELKIILQIKKIKRGDALKYILHGIKDPETGRKMKKITIECLAKQLSSGRIGFSQSVAMKMAKYLIEQPNEEGKVEQMDDPDSKITHAQAVYARRKDLQPKLLDHIKDYMLYNGLAITSMLNRIQGMFEDYSTELLQELEDQDYDEVGTAAMDEIIKSMKLVGLYPDSFDEDIRDFIDFLAMRHSKTLDDIEYKDFMKVFEEDYSFIDDKKSIWEGTLPDGSAEPPYEPSSDDGELESDKSPEKSEELAEDEEGSPDGDDGNRTSGNIEELDQNELLEKVDEILMQIVQKLPQSQKIRSLTEFMTPYLIPVYDQQQQRQYPIISQDAFIQFLLGQGENQLGLQLDENHVICLLHLLVQEDDEGNGDDLEESQSQNKFILFEEFIELVKTYMTKELIMQQSKSLGINYDILSKASVEFLFQIRSSLMHDNNQNINENSADEEDDLGTPGQGGGSEAKQKSVPVHVREIFGRIIQRKSISMSKGQKKAQCVEVIDFDAMLDVLFMRLGIHCPGSQAQEELKFLMCLDFKYLEMVKLQKFDKIMHDLDYISIDLLRQAQETNLDKQRRLALDNLKLTRETQLSKLKRLQAKKSAMNKGQLTQSEAARQVDNGPQIYGTSSQQVEYQGVLAATSQSTKQDKKRKRPDDKKQNMSKKLGQRSQFPNDMNIDASGSANQMSGSAGVEKAILPKQHRSKNSQEYRDGARGAGGAGQNAASGSQGKERYGSNNNQPQKMQQASYEGEMDLDMNIDVERSQTHQEMDIEDRVKAAQDRKLYAQPGDDFDNIDVNLDTDINNLDKNDQQKQVAIAAEIAAAENISEFDDEYLHDDIPIDDGEDEDGIISDNYDNFEDSIQGKVGVKSPAGADGEVSEDIADLEDSSRKDEVKQSALDDNVISMDHSDDIDESAPQNQIDMHTDIIQDSNDDDDDVDDMIEDVPGMRGMSRDMGQIVDDDEDIDDDYVEELMDDEVNGSDAVYDSDDAASPSKDGPGKKQGMSPPSEDEIVDSSPGMDRKSSRKAASKFQDEPEEDIESDNYSDGGLNTNLNDDDQGVNNLLNFNQVEKDSSIQQIKTHEDDDKFLSSGSKGSEIEEVNQTGRSGGTSQQKKSSSRLSREDRLGLQTAVVKDPTDRIEESGGVAASGMSSPSKSSPKGGLVDSENYEDDIEDPPSSRKSESIQMMKSKSVSKSLRPESEAPEESIADDYQSSKVATPIATSSRKDALQDSSVQQLDEESYKQIEDEYIDDMMDKQSSIKSQQKSISNASLPRLNNNSTHKELPRAASKADDDAIDEYVDDFAAGSSSGIQEEDGIAEDEGAAAGGVDDIDDEVYEEDLDVSLTGKAQPKPRALDAKKQNLGLSRSSGIDSFDQQKQDTMKSMSMKEESIADDDDYEF